ncbi:MAG: hypothetical protein ACK4UV_04645 [Ignavibacterium sp.]
MKKKEWRQLIKQIYFDSILPKLGSRRKYFHPFEWHEYILEYDEILGAMRFLRFIELNFSEDDELTNYFTIDYLKRILNAVESAINLDERLIVDSGILETIEKYFEEIIEQTEIDDFPEQDINALRESGSVNPKRELRQILFRIKKERTRNKYNDNIKFTFELKHSKEKIEKRRKQLDSENSKPKRSIFKGLGNITRGTILTVVDFSLLIGAWSIPLSNETTSVGAVVSITTGIGDIMTGIGDFRGE